MKKVLLCPTRVRRLPAQFSWIDQRLARHRYFERASSQAWALYLFLLTVADAQGLSYYADHTLCQRLGLQAATLAHARQSLLRLGLIAYSPPLYQVLALDHPPPCPTPAAALPTPPTVAHQHLHILRQRLTGGAL
jgi:hypothetical protein